MRRWTDKPMAAPPAEEPVWQLVAVVVFCVLAIAGLIFVVAPVL